ISDQGIANLITSTPYDGDLAFQNNTWTLMNWTGAVPTGTILYPGERYGIQFQANISSAASSGNAQLRIDSNPNNKSSFNSPAA
ncbi:hypothetical protein OVW19_30055, partial [Klebsiella pneumoniae]|uniref:hypothetical protein n=1 Tax=Klebsiella pneumoniae TaxID=573 RepID=UPI002270FFEE